MIDWLILFAVVFLSLYLGLKLLFWLTVCLRKLVKGY